MPKRDKNIKVVTLQNGQKRYKFNTYVGSIAVPGSRKKKRVFKSGTYKTYNEAKVAYDKARADGVSSNYAASKQKTVDEVYQEWLQYYSKNVEGSSYYVTNCNYKNHIQPTFGKMYIDKIDADIYQKWVNDLAEKIVNFSQEISIFDRLYKYAVIKRYCLPQDNPKLYVLIPKKHKKGKDNEHNFYTLSELRDFLQAAKKYSYRTYVYFYLLASTGMRKGEANALTWSKIDLVNCTIRVDKTRTVDKYNRPITKNGTKTKDSTRQVIMSNKLARELAIYQKHSRSDQTDLVFHIANHALDKNASSNWLKAVYKKNPQLKVITTHGFRHTFATLMRNDDNVKDIDVQFSLGHDNLTMTNHYTHKTKKEAQRVQAALQKMNL